MPKGKKSTNKKMQLEQAIGKTFERFINEDVESGTSRQDITAKLVELSCGKIQIKPSSIFNWIHQGIEEGTITNFHFRTRIANESQVKAPKAPRPQKITKPKNIIEVEEATEKVSESQELECQSEDRDGAEQTCANVVPIETLMNIPNNEIQDVDGKEDDGDEEELEEMEIIPELHSSTININCHCEDCGHDFEKETKCSETHLLALRTIQCPKCNVWGHSVVCFELNGVKARKAMLPEGTYQVESFIDEAGNKVSNPFELTTTT